MSLYGGLNFFPSPISHSRAQTPFMHGWKSAPSVLDDNHLILKSGNGKTLVGSSKIPKC